MNLFSSISTAALLFVGTALPTSVLASTSASFGPLVTPKDLSARLSEVAPIILDIRGDAYAKGHIEGAISAPYGLFRGPANNPGQLLDAATLEERFEALGLSQEKAVVIAPVGKTDTDFGAAARVYWTLKSSGFTDLSILNGGVIAWQSAGLPLSTDAATPQPTELDIVFSDQWTASTDAVAAVTRGEVDALLLDARTPAFYDGEKSHKAAARPGTLPGAANHSYTSFFDDGSPLMSGIESKSGLEELLGVESGQEIVSFCNTGHWAATNWFAMSEVAELENVKLYPGSMVEYSHADGDLEMANVPGLLKNLVNKATGN
jgi:thiosulfate/3-mercaptopyruvate sulfurtransferase